MVALRNLTNYGLFSGTVTFFVSIFILNLNCTFLFANCSSVIAIKPATYNQIPNFDFLYSNISHGANLNDTEAKCSSVINEIRTLQNPGFELGLANWIVVNAASVVANDCLSGKYCVRVGKISGTNGESKISQNFVAAPGQNLLSFWYKMTCPFNVNYNWMTAVVVDHTSGTLWTLPKICKTSEEWELVTTSVISGHSYTLTLINNDNIYFPTFTIFDDVTLSPSMLAPCIGYNSEFWYKYDIQNPTMSVSNFYLHTATMGMSFAQLVGWDSVGIDLPGMPLLLADPSTCAYICTLSNGCVGAVWDSIYNQCWLKSTYGSPTQVQTRNLLIPVGSASCPASLILSGNCIRPSYNIIPHFDFTSNNQTANVATDLTDAVIKCTRDIMCMGFSSSYLLKNDISQAVSSTTDFFIHAVAFGMEFVLIAGWDSSGGDDVSGYTGMPIATPNVAYCTYLCTLSSECVGAVWDGVTSCWLKSSFGPPNQSSKHNLLIPAGTGGCSTSVVASGKCIQSALSNKIPNFDFIGGNMILEKATNMADAIMKCFNMMNPSCIGFNGTSYLKNDFTGAVISDTDFYVNTVVSSGMSFVQLVGWDSVGIDLEGYAGVILPIPTVSYCAYLCTNTTGCVGAVWDPTQTKCWLKGRYGPPSEVANRNMLIPVGNGGCPASFIISGNCITSINDTVTLCHIMVSWNLYSNITFCLLHIKSDYSAKIEYQNSYITGIYFSDLKISGSMLTELSTLTALQVLQLSRNQLTGTIPSDLGRLTLLQILSLYSNQLTGSIPSELGKLTTLVYLSLFANQLTNTIPTEISCLGKLQALDLSFNDLSGNIPSGLSKLATLQVLYLDNNQLTGIIPSELGELSVLIFLSLYSNQLTGTIPSELGGLSFLKYFVFNVNKLTGTIPSELGKLSALQILDVNNNQLTGTIPSQLSKLSALQFLVLHTNQLTGTIPSELFELSVILVALNINKLSGTIPSDLGKASSLQYLYMGNNQLTGTIPSELSKLTGFQQLALNANKLTGTIPSELSALSGLQYLFLYENQLTGKIPSELSQLSSLQSLFLHNNLLTEEIPSQLGLLTNLLYLYLPDNQLSGTLPTEICQLESLISLGIYGNKLTGTLTTQLAQLKSLKTLNIDNNLLDIPLPDELNSFFYSALGFFLAPVVRPVTHNSNSFIGSLPSQMGLMKSLQNIYIENNLITGSLPSEFGLLENLVSISMTSNQMSGSIPSQVGKLNKLTEIHLSNNQLSGQLPSELANLSLLIDLYLSSNQLTGSIPKKFGKLMSLQQLQLSNNLLTGSIAVQFSKLQALKNFDVNTNQLTGSIPSELANLATLQYLTFDHNSGLNGTVSNGMCMIQSLLLITVSKDVTCPTNCSNKCLKLEFSNPSASPTYLRTAESSSSSSSGSSSSLSRGAIVGIIIGSFMFMLLFLLLVLLVLRCYSKNTQQEKTNNTDIENLSIYLRNNKLALFNWKDFDNDAIGRNIVVGEGSFGVVIRAKLIDSIDNNLSNLAARKELAIKVIQAKDLHDTYEYRSVLKEVQNHFDTEIKIFNKNCIVKLYGVVDGQLPKTFSKLLNAKTALGIVMHYEAGGSLSSLLHGGTPIYSHQSFPQAADPTSSFYNSLNSSDQNKISFVDKLNILRKVAQSLAELNKSGVAHGDLKPDNILLSSTDISKAEVHLADFGFTNFREKNQLNIGMSSLLQTAHYRGTPVYSAPEQFYNANTQSINPSIDIGNHAKPSAKTNAYSFAIIAWEILTQHKPFVNFSTVADLTVAVHQGVRPDIKQLPPECPDAIRIMIERCWDSDRQNRLSTMECFMILKDVTELLLNTQYDVYITFRHASPKDLVIRSIRSRLIENGFKVAPLYNADAEVSSHKEMNSQLELIKQCKVILYCLEVATQSDRCTRLLKKNQRIKRPRRVIPLYLESRRKNFPSNQTKEFYMKGRETTVFDISNYITNESTSVYPETTNNQNPVHDNDIINPTVGVDPLDLEFNRLVEYIHYTINNLCNVESVVNRTDMNI